MNAVHAENAVTPNSALATTTGADGVVEDIAAILSHERSHYLPCFDYLTYKRSDTSSEKSANEDCRYKMIEWAFKIVDYFNFDREVVSIMISYLDRMSAHIVTKSKRPVSKVEYQTAAITALYLAMKLHGECEDLDYKPTLSVEPFVKMSRGLMTKEKLEAAELQMLSALDWHVNPPSMVCFVSSFLRLLPTTWDNQAIDSKVSRSIFEMSRYLTELSALVSSFAFQFKNSETAYAAILCTMDSLQGEIDLPYAARIAFQDKMAEATSMTANSSNIVRASIMIKSLDHFRYKYEQTDLQDPAGTLSRASSAGSETGTTSPVTVCEPVETGIRDQKRTRLTYDEY